MRTVLTALLTVAAGRRVVVAGVVAILLAVCAGGVATAGERLIFDALIGTSLFDPAFGPPPTPDYGIPSGLAIDSRGFLYVADPKNNRVLLYDGSSSAAKTLTALTNSSGGSVTLNFPIGVAVDLGTDDVWITNGKAFQLVKIDKDGQLLLTVGSQGSGAGQFEGPAFVAVDAGGNVYVTDDGGVLAFNHQIPTAIRVQKFRSDGSFVTSWGSFCDLLATPPDPGCNTAAPGAVVAGDGQFLQPNGIAVDSANNVYVVDDINDRVQKFNSTGTFLTKWGSTGSGNGAFRSPRGIAVDLFDNVYVADANNDRIQKFNSTGTFLSKEGSPAPSPPGVPGLGAFRAPSSIVAEPKKLVLLCALLGLRCQKILFGEASSANPRVLQMDAFDDADNDGLLKEVDLEPNILSTEFSLGHLTARLLTGLPGTFVVSAPTPQAATPRPLFRPGVLADTIRVTTGYGTSPDQFVMSMDWSCGGANLATSALGTTTVQLHCSTPTMDVLTGGADLGFTAPDGTLATASLLAGDGVMVLEATSGIQATTGAPIVVIGSTSVTLVPGQTVFADTTPPSTSASGSPAPNGNGWSNADVTETLKAVDNAGGSGVKQIQFALVGAQAGGATVNGDTASVVVNTEGLTVLSYAARDNAGNQETTKNLTIRLDKTPPVLTIPATLTVDATSPAGALVTYAASATDNLTASPTVACAPSSGSTFLIGTTTVNCTAADDAGNTSSGSFTVLVQAAATQITNLMSNVQSLNLRQGITNSLDAKLSNAEAALTAAKGGNATSACNQLSAFVNETRAQAGKALTLDQANQLLTAVDRIKAVISCP